MSTPRVSVVMPAYNAERHLGEAIASVLGQTFADFEFIIVDDGSTDGSRTLLQRETDPRIRIIHQSNTGIVGALNAGIASARGELIARQDSDDASLPERLERQVAFLSDHPDIAMVGSWFERFDDAGRPLGTTYTMSRDVDIRREFFIRNPFGHGTVMIRAEVLRAVGGYRSHYPHNEDVDLWRRVIERHPVANLPEVLYRWRVNPDGITQRQGGVQAAETARLLNRIWAEVPIPDQGLHDLRAGAACARTESESGRDGSYGQYFVDQYYLAGELIRRGSPLRGMRTLLYAWLADPQMLFELVGRRLRNRTAQWRQGARPPEGATR